MGAKGYNTVSIKINLLKAIQKIADREDKTRSAVIHEVLWAYATLQGVA